MPYAAILAALIILGGCYNAEVLPDNTGAGRKQEIYDQCAGAVHSHKSPATLINIVQDPAERLELWIYRVDHYSGIRDSLCLGVREMEKENKKDKRVPEDTYWSHRNDLEFKDWFLLPDEHRPLGVFKSQLRWYIPCTKAGEFGVATDRLVVSFDLIKREFRLGPFTEINRRKHFDYAEVSTVDKPKPAASLCSAAVRAPAYAGKLAAVFRDAATPWEFWTYHIQHHQAMDNVFCLGIRQNDGSTDPEDYERVQATMKFSFWYLLPGRWKPIGILSTNGYVYLPCEKDRDYERMGVTLVFSTEKQKFFITGYNKFNPGSIRPELIKL